MSLEGKSLAFVLVLISACIHASWNVAARHLKGNFSMLVLAHFLGAILSLPLVFVYGDFVNSFWKIEMWYFLIPTTIFQAAYTAMLSAAYFYGDVGLVYPLARGTAITLSTVVSQLFSISAPINAVESGGIVTVVIGIMVLAYDAYLNLSRSYVPVKVVDDSIDDFLDLELPEFMKDSDTASTVGSSTAEEVSGEADHHDSSEDSDENFQLSTHPNDSTAHKVTLSIAFALCVGLCTASYSITDSFGVNVVPALTYSFFLNFLSAVIYAPYIYLYKYEELVTVLRSQLVYLFAMAPAVTGAYLIILFVFEIPGVNVAMVVTLREFSVLIGTILGVFLLKEAASSVKIGAVVIICMGMALLKLG